MSGERVVLGSSSVSAAVRCRRSKSSKQAKAASFVSRSQSRQNDASTSRVGIERLRPLVQRGQEILVVLKPRHSTGSKILVSLALTLLPFLSPKPRLLGVDPAIGDLLKQDHGTINCAVGKAVDKVVEVSLSHIRILTAASGVHQLRLHPGQPPDLPSMRQVEPRLPPRSPASDARRSSDLPAAQRSLAPPNPSTCAAPLVRHLVSAERR